MGRFVCVQIIVILTISSAFAQNVTESDATGENLNINVILSTEIMLKEENLCQSASSDVYSMRWHVAGVFIILIASASGIFTTITLGIQTSRPLFAKSLQV